MISEILDDLDELVREELTTPVEIVECEEFPEDFYSEARKWKRIEDLVVVVGDLSGSTKLNFHRHVNTSASIYESATGGAVRVVTDQRFQYDYIQIQGDGFFALFHGERAYERAFCAAVTLKTFSEKVLVPQIEKHLSERTPKTGFKTGIAAGVIAAKRVGRRGVNDIVWAGKPVNWAFKCAQAADRHELIVTDRVYNKLKNNDYARWSCGCDGSGTPTSILDLWSSAPVTKLPTKHSNCYKLKSGWCDVHGDEFAMAILNGDTRRDDISHHHS